MKLIISLLLMTSLNAKASLITIGFESERFEQAQLVREIFRTHYDVPKDLILIKHVENCGEFDALKSGMFFCVDTNRQLNFTKLSNFELTKKTVLSFSEKGGERYVF